MQRKTFHLVAVALLALGVVISVVGGVGDRFSSPAKRTEAPPPAPPSAPKAGSDPSAPAWTFAPRRPIDESAAPGTAAGPDATAAAGAASVGGTPGTPGSVGAAPGSPGAAAGAMPGDPRSAQGSQGPFGSAPANRLITPGPPTAECPRGTLVRAGTSGPQVFCVDQ